MPKEIGTFTSKRWGAVRVLRGHYGSATGPTAIILELADGEPLGKLSISLYRPECSRDSKDLPEGCFFAKEYDRAIEELAAEALASGMFKVREDLGVGRSGYVEVRVWEVVQPAT